MRLWCLHAMAIIPWREKNKMEPRDVVLNQEPVELYKILKFENLVMSGGEAKHVITEGLVMVNGEVENRKRKKIFGGDIVEFQGEQLHLVVEKKM